MPAVKALDDVKLKAAEAPLQGVVDAASDKRRRQRVVFAISDPEVPKETVQIPVAPRPIEDTPSAVVSSSLAKSAMNIAEDIRSGKPIQRLAFEEDPTKANYYQALWIPKPGNILPDQVLKQIGLRDSLIASIVQARTGHIAQFGRELQDRFATGFRIEPRRNALANATPEQKQVIQERILAASKLMNSCGHTEGVPEDKRISLATFLGLQTRNGLLNGRFATEIIFLTEPDGERTFHSFQPIDVSTIYRAAPTSRGHADQVREQALTLLEKLRGPEAARLRPEKFRNDEYRWIQVLDNRPRQAFTAEEMYVHNLYPVTDIEMRGYPISPIDTAIDAILTHLNITQHNKLYFQSGRAARGMVVIKSTDVDQGLVHDIRRHFNASINSVQNAWRVPTFGIDPDDDVEWIPLDSGTGRDMEFQYLSDSNAREICAAFQISPEELPGYQHLSRGTNNQALSESNNEYKLLAARDVGIRPLLNQIQDFLNERILPLIDPIVASLCTVKLYGLDADTAEKEDTRITQAMAIDLTMDEILERKEKDPLGATWGGTFPLNPGWQAIVDKYIPVGKIQERFFGVKGASQDPNFNYLRDPFWFQFQQLQLQVQQLQMQEQQMQAQAAAGAPPEEDKGGGGDGEEPESELAQGADQVIDTMNQKDKGSGGGSESNQK
jgi:hypothetical protein